MPLLTFLAPMKRKNEITRETIAAISRMMTIMRMPTATAAETRE